MFDHVLGFVVRFLLFPVVLLVCTPFIFIRAAVLTWRDEKFWRNVADGYYAIDVYWWP
jgi:hypothetical protein